MNLGSNNPAFAKCESTANGSAYSNQTPAKACFVIVYFGTWPPWIDYFLRSCALNPEIHWMIFTDCGIIKQVPSNVLIKNYYKSTLEDLISAKLNIAYKFSYGYKLCDMKPAYGHFFSEYLENYLFWGYTDLDIVYGNIAYFITPDILRDHDIITASEKILVGHFTLIRNNERTKTLYQNCTGYLEKFIEERYQSFDENDFSSYIKSIARGGDVRLYEKNIQTDDCLIWWSGRPRFLIVWWKGNVTDLLIGRRLCYFHFIQSKYGNKFRSTPPKTNKSFYIDHNGIRQPSELIGILDFTWSLLGCFVATLPFYGKTLVKFFLPEGARRALRNLLSQVVARGQDG